MEWTLERVNGPKNFIVLDKSERSYTCGRNQNNKIVCLSLVVSRRHCIFVRADDVISVIDLGSSNGIFVNGKSIEPNVLVELQENDVIGIGSLEEYRDNEPMFIFKLHKGNLGSRNLEEFDDLLTQRSSSSSKKSTTSEVAQTSAPVLNKRPGSSLKRNLPNDAKDEVTPVLPSKVSKLSDGAQKVRDEDIDVLKTKQSRSSRVSTKAKEPPEVEEIEEIWSTISPQKISKPKTNGTSTSASHISNRLTLTENEDESRKPSEKEELAEAETKLPKSVSLNLTNGEVSQETRRSSASDTQKEMKDEEISEEKSTPIMQGRAVTMLSPENPHKTIRFSLDASSTNTRLTVDILDTNENSEAVRAENIRRRSNSGDSEKSEKKKKVPHSEAAKKSKEVSNGQDKAKKISSKSSPVDANSTANKSKPERLSFLNKEPVAASSPIKLKHVKQEPMTSFSVFDTVDISDDDDDIFPSSQLFDSTNDNSSLKVEDEFLATKTDEEEEELDKNLFTEIDAVIQESEEIITLSDSDDEENPWLHRLSESQRIKEEKPDVAEPDISKPESPQMEFVDELFETKQGWSSKVETTDVEVPRDERIDSQVRPRSIIKSPRSMTPAEIEKEINDDNDEPDLCKDEESDAKILHASGASPDPKERRKSNEKSLDESPGTKQGALRGPKIIEPLHLPQRRRLSTKGEDFASPSTSKGHIKLRDCSVEVPKLPPNFTAKQRRELQLEDKKKQRKYEEEQRIRRLKNKFAQKVNLPLGKRTSPSISKKEKLEIVKERKEKLKTLATKQKSESVKPSIGRIAAKPKAKISTKNRGDFLITDQPTTSSKVASEAPEAATSKKEAKSATVTTKSSKIKSRNSEATSKSISSEKSTSKEKMREETSAKRESKTKASSTQEKKRAERRSKSVERSNDSSAKSLENKTKESSKETSSTQKENRVPNLMDKSEEKNRKKKKKKVSFNENLVTVREYQIDPNNTMKKCTGKDALIPKEKLSAARKVDKTQHPKLEEFLMHIFKWNPSWLEEQRHLKTEPPIVNYDLLVPLLTSYKSYKDYYQVLMPLLLLELWYGITKEFETIDQNNRRQTVFCSVVENSVTYQPIPSTNTALTTMLLEVLASEDDIRRQIHPIYGDLVFLELCYKDEQGTQKFLKVFAYVTQLHRTLITPHTFFNRDLMKHTRNPTRVLTYTVLMRPLKVQLCINRVLRLRCVTYLRANMRMVQALQSLPCSPLLDLILNPKIEQYQLSQPVKQMQQSSLVTGDKLNHKQIEAVLKTTEAIVRKEPKVCLVQGPPGTGKSEVIVNMVMQVLYGDNRYRNRETTLRILLCAPSNAAIDEIVLRLLDRRAKLTSDRFKMVRVGLLGPMHPRVREISVEELAKRDVKRTVASYQSCGQSMSIVEEEKRFLEARINALQSELNSSQQKDEGQIQYTRIKLSEMRTRYDLMKNCTQAAGNNIDPRDLTKLQRGAESKILICADIIACTLSSCYTNIMESAFGGTQKNISVCIVDEATQSCEAETLIPLMLGVNTLVLVGDPAQLPATVISQRAKKLGLDQSLFSRAQRVFEGVKNTPVIMLDVQYRMDAHISYWPNRYFYGGKLRNGKVGEHSPLPFQPYRVLNLDSVQNSDKFSNTQEAEFVANLIYGMINHLDAKRPPQIVSIGVITPYRNQQTLVRARINHRLAPILDNLKVKINTEVNTVDSFQGHECDVIVMSCVRTNGIGFLSDAQRLCVALTRAKHCLVMCGNFATFQRDPMWRELLKDAQSRKSYIDVKADARPSDIISKLVK